jgi:hypothetical protein
MFRPAFAKVGWVRNKVPDLLLRAVDKNAVFPRKHGLFSCMPQEIAN